MNGKKSKDIRNISKAVAKSYNDAKGGNVVFENGTSVVIQRRLNKDSLKYLSKNVRKDYMGLNSNYKVRYLKFLKDVILPKIKEFNILNSASKDETYPQNLVLTKDSGFKVAAEF